jgi:glycosyltransferase involved in cell wall biosynthesis
MRILIATENASMRMSGEAALPIYYFERLRQRGVEVWMICHIRNRDELRERYPNEEDFQRFYFVEDSSLQETINNAGEWIPFRIRDLILGQWIHWITQSKARLLAKGLVKQLNIQLVFEPAPISPKALSCMYDLGAPVAIGPLCGGMDFPPAFRHLESPIGRMSTQVGRMLSQVVNYLVPGKLQAEVLLVANERTAKALPKGCRGKIYEVVESGVDLSLWQPSPRPVKPPEQPTRFVYMARFVDQKGIPFLIEAFKQVADKTNSVLELIGDGELYQSIKNQVAALKIQDRVVFHGRLPLETAAELVRECDVYMVPAIRDCGGCAMLEAMAIGMPVIAANWAGPGEYADSSCGILVDTHSHEEFVNGLAAAMVRLTESPELRQQMGEASLKRVRDNYLDWDSKVDRIIEIFEETLAVSQPHSSTAASNSLPWRSSNLVEQ